MSPDEYELVTTNTVQEDAGMASVSGTQTVAATDGRTLTIAEWCKPATRDWRVRIHSQDIMENSVDSAHFAAVHGHRLPVNTFTAEGKELRISQQTEVRRLGSSST